MAESMQHKMNTGISPQEFVERMKANQAKFQEWYDRFRWESEEDRSFFRRLQERNDLHSFVLAADWCGDVVRNAPVVFRVLEEAHIPTDVLIMEKHLDVMDRFRTMGGRAIPKVIFTDAQGDVLADWGPRPDYIQEVMTRFKQEHPDREEPGYDDGMDEVRKEIMRRYGDDTEYQQVIVKELRALLAEK